MSSGFMHNEGRLITLLLLAGQTASDRGTNLELRLFTACAGTRSATTTKGSFTEPTGGGYAAIQLPPSSLSVAGVVLTPNVAQIFTANASGYSGGQVLGYFICTTGATPRVVTSELFDAGPYTMGPLATLTIWPQLNLNQ